MTRAGGVRRASAVARSLGLAVCVVGMVAVPLAAARNAPAVEAQARAFGVLAVALQAPVASALTERLTRAPVVEERTIAEVPATVVRPPGRGPFPAVVFVNGATPEGRRQPDVRRLARALGRVGFLTVVPDPPGLARGAVTARTLAATTAVTDAVARRPDVAEGRLALVSVSVGASLALLVAADERVAARLTVVAGIAPFADAREAVRLGTTGHHRVGARLARFEPDPFLRLVVARALVAMLPPRADRDALAASLDRVADRDAAAGVDAALAGHATTGDPALRAVVDLLRDRSPSRFDERYARLPVAVRTQLAGLSPIATAADIAAPVELATPPRDKYFPRQDQRALAARAPRGRLTVSSTLDHAVPELTPGDLLGPIRLDGFVVRTLRHADPRRTPLSTTLALWGAALLASAMAGVCAAKGKGWTGALGLIVPPLLLVGALRRARPGSWWAVHRSRSAP